MQIVALRGVVPHELGQGKGFAGEETAAHEAPRARDDARDERVVVVEGRGLRGSAGDFLVLAVGARDVGVFEVGGAG